MLLQINKIDIERKLTKRPRVSRPLHATSSYSCFVTNKVFDECKPFEQITYAAVQYLLFHSLKPSCRNIAKNVNLSDSAIKKALCSLRKRRFIVKQDDGGYLFGNTKLDGSTELVGAKEITRARLGYWFPIDVLKNNRINNQAKRAFALILSLTKSGDNQIDMAYIGKKLKLSRQKASPLVGSLLSEGLISRHRNHHRSVYIYKVGERTMSIYKKGVPMVTSKGVPMVTTLSIKESSISILDKRKDRLPSDTDKNGKNKNISFWKEEEIKLNAQYTEACNDYDWSRMQEIRAELTAVDREIKR